MAARENSSGVRLRRIGAALLCLALLYFAGGGSFLHQHQGAPDTVCHVCQSLHAPVLTVTLSGVASAPQISGTIRGLFLWLLLTKFRFYVLAAHRRPLDTPHHLIIAREFIVVRSACMLPKTRR